MHKMFELKDTLCAELDEFAKKEKLTTEDLNTIDKLTHSIKSIETIIAMKGNSNEYGPNYGYSRNMDNAGRYSRDANMNGTYNYGMSYPIRDYSYDNHNVMNELRAMLDSATSEKERSAISRCIESMSY